MTGPHYQPAPWAAPGAPQPTAHPLPPRPPGGHRRRWPALIAAAVLGAILAGTATAVGVIHARDDAGGAEIASAPMTVTVAPAVPPAPKPLPATEADRLTCRDGWLEAGNYIRSARATMRALPPGVKVGDPTAMNNPEWRAVAQEAADSYRKASEVLEAAIAPGTTPVLAEAAHTSVKALRLLADSIATSDPITGNAIEIGNEAGPQTRALCVRLAP